ncbi:MAG: saccharopine dehydrogenase NADP-binding domain-containing protein [Bacteroidetes bacterium]|nr:saccharopine dehydrogenase NADP-binding domain-containing protein [Bacteroidota bacterium]
MNGELTQPAEKTPPCWLLYGANGYTGKIIAEEAQRRGMRPLLAGRNREAVAALAEALGLEYRVFDLASHDEIVSALQDVEVVLHCAGPFTATSRPMVDACISAGAHYMDITGEIPVLESLFALHDTAVHAGISIIPGAGFDVVPTDCLALSLKEEMPDATSLRLAFAGKVTQSPGTWRATLEAIPRCGAIRRDGKLVTVPHAWRATRIHFDDKPRSVMTIPWGDVSSAWRSTRIPNIMVFGGVPRLSIAAMQLFRGIVCTVMGVPALQRALKSMVSWFVRGPGERHRKTEVYHLRGDVWNDRGEHAARFMVTPEGYACTVLTSLAILETLLEGKIAPGVWTPAQAMGSGFAATLPGFRVMECADTVPQPGSEYAFDS